MKEVRFAADQLVCKHCSAYFCSNLGIFFLENQPVEVGTEKIKVVGFYGASETYIHQMHSAQNLSRLSLLSEIQALRRH